MEQLKQYTGLQSDTLLNVLEENITELKHPLFKEILTHLQNSNFVDEAYCDYMKEERRRIKKRIRNHRNYLKKKSQRLALEKEVERLTRERELLIQQRGRYVNQIKYYRQFIYFAEYNSGESYQMYERHNGYK